MRHRVYVNFTEETSVDELMLRRPISLYGEVLDIVRYIPKNIVLRDRLTPNILVKLIDKKATNGAARTEFDTIIHAHFQHFGQVLVREWINDEQVLYQFKE